MMKKENGSCDFLIMPTIMLIIMLIIIFLCLPFWFRIRVNNHTTIKILKSMSYSNIKTHGYSWFACSKRDVSHTKFTATSLNGSIVSGAVCCGLIFKNCTVRYSQ